MSVENIKRFQEELQTNDELKEKLKDLKLSYENLEELLSFAKKAGFDFTLEELKEINSKPVAEELSVDELDKVVGGLTDASGRWLTTIAFGCEHWFPHQSGWLAVKGQCGSCMYWHPDWTGAGFLVVFGFPGVCSCEENRRNGGE